MTDLSKAVRQTLAEATRAMNHRAHTPAGFSEPTQYIPAPAVRSMIAVLSTSKLPALFDKNGNLVRTPKGKPAAVTTTAPAAIIAASRVARAGANVVICDDPDTARVIGPAGAIAMERVPTQFRVIQPAGFSVVDVETEDELPVSSLPTLAAPIDWKSDAVKHLGVRMEFPRSVIRRIDSEQLCDEIVASITLGIAKAADSVLLAALDPATLPTYDNSLAAAAGLGFDELSMLVGAAFDPVPPMGRLQGNTPINVELCGDIPGGVSVVGAFNRAGVAVRGEVPIHWQRMGLDGGMAVTAWITLLPLVPKRGMFWRARNGDA